jgi:hypothetical protein
VATPSQKRSAAKIERLKHIRTLMAACQWVPGITNVQVAQKFGVSTKTLEADAAEAHRQIASAIGSDEELKVRLLASLAHLAAKAERINTANGIRAAVEGLRVLAGIAGVEAPKKVDVEVQDNLAALISMGLTGAPGAKTEAKKRPPKEPPEAAAAVEPVLGGPSSGDGPIGAELPEDDTEPDS